MHTFFHGWRRKAGCATLVMACAVMGCWIRGRAICDIADYSFPRGWHRLNVSCFGLKWFRFESDDIGVHYGNDFQITHHAVGSANGPIPAEFHFSAEGDDQIISHWHLCGFHVGETIGTSDRLRMKLWVIPYWSVTIPLTLLSAYLILWKPRQPPKPTDPGNGVSQRHKVTEIDETIHRPL